MKKSNGIILFEGNSQLDGKPIVVIVTGFTRKSKNPKTGNLLQSYIIRNDMNPFTAYIKSKDCSVCGSCFMRKIKACYVNKAQAPLNVYAAYKRGVYAPLSKSNIKMFNNRILRIGSYGDPAAAPLNIWEKVIKASKSFVGYSHNWMHCNQRWNKYLMASIETIKQQELANKKGWRTFRIMVDNSKVSNNEIHCPASIEMGKKTTCEKCLSCGGNHSKLKKNVAIVAHGRVAKKFSRIMRLRMNKKKYTHLVK